MGTFTDYIFVINSNEESGATVNGAKDVEQKPMTCLKFEACRPLDITSCLQRACERNDVAQEP